jgi:hypothetical protein
MRRRERERPGQEGWQDSRYPHAERAYLVQDAGIRQFLDIGTGVPKENNVHEVAQRAAPESRVVYVDRDPIVLAIGKHRN